MARPGARLYAECREPKTGRDQGLSQVEPTDRVWRVWAGREIRLGGVRAGGPELWRVGQAGPRRSTSLCGKSDRDKRGADNALNSRISRQRGGEGCAVRTAPLQRVVHTRGYRAAGGSGSGARAIERAGDAPYSSARIRALWGQKVRADNEEQQGGYVQLCGPAR